MFPFSKVITGSTSLLFLQCLLHEIQSLSLNPAESFLLKGRLTTIQNTVRNEQTFQSSQPLRPIVNPKLPKEKETGHDHGHNLVLIFPGVGGPDQFMDELESTVSDITKDTSSPTIVSTLDWGDFRGSLLTAAFDGEAFGESIGDLIWERFMVPVGASKSSESSGHHQ